MRGTGANPMPSTNIAESTSFQPSSPQLGGKLPRNGEVLSHVKIESLRHSDDVVVRLDFAGVKIETYYDVIRMSKDRKSTRLNSSHRTISYAVFCLKKKKKQCSPNTATS